MAQLVSAFICRKLNKLPLKSNLSLLIARVSICGQVVSKVFCYGLALHEVHPSFSKFLPLVSPAECNREPLLLCP